MGQRIGIAGFQASGKSYGRRYIPDGENVVIIQPSVKTSHLFTGPANVNTFTPAQIDEAIKKGTRKAVGAFDIVSPEKKYKSISEALSLAPEGKNTLAYFLANILAKKNADYFGGEEGQKFITGNIMLCENIENLHFFIDFINKFMPWIHTIILPDFTHYISEVLTSPQFINKKAGGEQYAKYLDLAADSLRQFIKKADTIRPEIIIVTEFHVEFIPEGNYYEIFTPGGKMLKEKLLPSSYYDTFLFTDVKYSENDEGEAEHRFVTRKIRKYPEARSLGFDELFIPNNLQLVLDAVRKYNNIPIPVKEAKK